MDRFTPPRDNLVRALHPGIELRADGEAGMPTLHGHFARFNAWNEINSLWEGRFLERISPGAFKKSIRENFDRIRALFQHGRDPQIGDKPLGPISVLREDEEGPYYEVPLLDTAYNRELIPGLEKGLYGASYRFQVMKEEVNEEPNRSDHNPDGLPERTIKEVRLMEFGPVTFPADPGASAAVRSMTDEFLISTLTDDPERFRALIAEIDNKTEAREEPEDVEAEAEPHSDDKKDLFVLTKQGAEAEPHSEKRRYGAPVDLWFADK